MVVRVFMAKYNTTRTISNLKATKADRTNSICVLIIC